MTTYADFKTRIKAYIEDDYTEFDTSIDDIVGNAELRISRDINLDAMLVRATGNFTIGAETLAKPASCVAIKWFTYTDINGDQQFLQFRTTSFLRDYAPNKATTGSPRYYGNLDEDTLELAPTPDATSAYEMEHEVRVDGLTASDGTSTWLSTDAEDLLLYACLVEGEIFHKNEGSLAMYEKKYEESLVATTAEVARIRGDSTSIRRKG